MKNRNCYYRTGNYAKSMILMRPADLWCAAGWKLTVKNKTWKSHRDAILNGWMDMTGEGVEPSCKMSGVGLC